MDWSEVLEFWFEEIPSKKWWVKDQTFDDEISKRFLKTHQRAIACELYRWRDTAKGRLAEIIVLDQFSRNIYRDTPKAFLYDSLALCLAQSAIQTGDDKKLSAKMLSFLYMPFMHSESATIHEVALQLFSQSEVQGNLEFEKKHKVIIDRFGRYPHRNNILGRESTPEEEEFLKGPNSSF